jgi:hypothetical protein
MKCPRVVFVVWALALVLSGGSMGSAQTGTPTTAYLAELSENVFQEQVTSKQILNIKTNNDEYIGRTFKAVGNLGYSVSSNALWPNNVVFLYVIDSPDHYGASLLERNLYTKPLVERFVAGVKARPYSMISHKKFEIRPELNCTFCFTVVGGQNGRHPTRLNYIKYPDGSVIKF